MQKQEDLKFLEEAALVLGAASARVIPADQVIVEDRVRLRCTVGCPSYGASLKCPPFVPTPEEFRRILKEYRFAMVVKHKSPGLPKEVKGLRVDDPEDAKKLKAKLWPEYNAYYQRTLGVMHELEKTAFASGYVFALAFFAGSCCLCEKCNVEKGVCLHPLTARIAAEAVGVNMVKTAENGGMELKFSMEIKPPEPMALLLID